MNIELQSDIKHSNKLSEKLGYMYMMKSINRLEKSRLFFTTKFDDLDVKLRDNGSGTESLNGVNKGGNLGMTYQSKELQEKFGEVEEQNKKLSKDNHNTDSQIGEVEKKVNQMERNVGDASVNLIYQAICILYNMGFKRVKVLNM